jgi:hypothetical protein
MAEPTDHDRVPTLPKWAQKYITHLEARARSAEEHILVLSQPESNEGTDTVWYSYGIRPDINLEKGAIIRFTDSADDVFQCYVKNGSLEIASADGPPGGDFSVQPVSGGRIRVKVDRS